MQPAVLQAYRDRFPADPAARDLDGWAAFEAEHPRTFAGMYRLWVRKVESTGGGARAAAPGTTPGGRALR